MIHPEYNFSEIRIGSLLTPSLNSVLELLTEIENRLSAPFSVFIHGDFNSNNIIYNQKEQQVYFIDLHRSCYNDYLQDVSVFLISNFRQPNFEKHYRSNINKMNLDYYHFAQKFARDNNDLLFKARLALGLVRSFFTSTRFELDPEFSRSMYQRSLYLAEKLISHHGKPWEEFDFPSDIFRYSTF